MKTIELNDGIVHTNDVSIYEVYYIDIDVSEKTIDVCDRNHMLVAQIKYEYSNGSIGYFTRDNDGNINIIEDNILEKIKKENLNIDL